MKNGQQHLKYLLLGRARAKITARWIAISTLALAMSGCAGLQSEPRLTDSIRINRIDSPKARIESVLVNDRAGQTEVNGNLRSPLQTRHRIRHQKRFARSAPGHLHIKAIAPDGGVLGEVTTRSVATKFTEILAVKPDQIKTIHVIHHQSDDDINPRPAT